MKRIAYKVDVGSGSTYGELIINDDTTEEEIMLKIMNDLYEVTWKEID